jgi:hypothetical protein
LSPTRKIALVSGLFFGLTFIHALILPLYSDILDNRDFILGDGDDMPVRLGAIVEVVTAIANAATGVLLFQVLRRQQLGIALGYVAVRIFEATIILVGTACLLAILTLQEDLGAATDADAANLRDIGSALVAVRDWTFMFGPGLCSGIGNGLLLGYLMFRSGLVPRYLALLGVIGGPLSLVGVTFVLFGQWEQDAPQQFLFTIGEIAWELSLTVFLVVKGFNATPLTRQLDEELSAA